MWKYLLGWLPMVAIAIANGALRELTYGRRLSERFAHQISTAIAALLLGAYIWLVVSIWPPVSAGQAVSIGLLWLVLTLAFEFLFGHFVAGHSWARLWRDYNLLAGRIWLLVPVCVAFLPYLLWLWGH